MNGIAFADPADQAKFVPGEAWYSYDDGKTWTTEFRSVPAPGVTFVVREVDQETGVVRVEARIEEGPCRSK